jgi:hypothetical protein
MEEPKLSEKERMLLEPFYESDVYRQALKPVLERWGNGIARISAEQADWDLVKENRGRLYMIKALHKFFKNINEKGRKSSAVKSK